MAGLRAAVPATARDNAGRTATKRPSSRQSVRFRHTAVPASSSEELPSELRRDLDACTGDGATYSFMVGIGETYLAAFAVALGMTGTASGLIAAVPPVAGGALQLLAPRCARIVGSPRRWVMLCATVQSASLILLAIGAALGRMPAWAVFAAASIYWTAALAAGGVWNAWVAELFPARLRARYFAQRNRLCQFLILAGLLLGGALIALGERWGQPLVAFSACFGLAASARLLSLHYLLRQGDLPAIGASHAIVPIRRVVAGRDVVSRILVAMLCLQAAVQVGQPFFNPFMLKALGYSPTVYTMAIAAAFVAKSLALPLAGRLADRYGAAALLVGSAAGVSTLAAVWLVSGDPRWILPSQLLAGAVWGGYELATFLILLEMIPHRERASVMGWFYFLNAAAMVAGSLLGAWLLAGEETRASYATVFAASTALRIVALVPFILLVRSLRRGKLLAGDIANRPLIVEPIAVRASAGSIDVATPVEAEADGVRLRARD